MTLYIDITKAKLINLWMKSLGKITLIILKNAKFQFLLLLKCLTMLEWEDKMKLWDLCKGKFIRIHSIS